MPRITNTISTQTTSRGRVVRSYSQTIEFSDSDAETERRFRTICPTADSDAETDNGMYDSDSTDASDFEFSGSETEAEVLSDGDSVDDEDAVSIGSEDSETEADESDSDSDYEEGETDESDSEEDDSDDDASETESDTDMETESDSESSEEDDSESSEEDDSDDDSSETDSVDETVDDIMFDVMACDEVYRDATNLVNRMAVKVRNAMIENQDIDESYEVTGNLSRSAEDLFAEFRITKPVRGKMSAKNRHTIMVWTKPNGGFVLENGPNYLYKILKKDLVKYMDLEETYAYIIGRLRNHH